MKILVEELLFCWRAGVQRKTLLLLTIMLIVVFPLIIYAAFELQTYFGDFQKYQDTLVRLNTLEKNKLLTEKINLPQLDPLEELDKLKTLLEKDGLQIINSEITQNTAEGKEFMLQVSGSYLQGLHFLYACCAERLPYAFTEISVQKEKELIITIKFDLG